MEIYFESDKSALNIIWTKDNRSLSTIEYIDCWIDILKNIEALKPKYLLIDTLEFDYRMLPEIDAIFYNISQKMSPENIAFIKCSHILGGETLNILLKSCPLKGHTMINNNYERIIWLNSRKSNLTHY